MLSIRLQRTGRKGHAQYRIIVQESQRTPTSGRVVARLGNYNPHNKEFNVDKEKATVYLKNGAQPSDRVARLLKKEGVKLPKWVSINAPNKRATRNPEKLRKNQPAKPVDAKPVEEPVTEEAKVESEETTEVATVSEPATEEQATELEQPTESAEQKTDKTEVPEETPAEEPEAEAIKAEPEEAKADSETKPKAKDTKA